MVRVKAATVTAGDARIRGLDVPRGFGLVLRLAFGWSRPRQPVQGWGFSGQVESIGPDVEGFVPGDAVMGITGAVGGAHAEFVRVPANRLFSLPGDLSFEEGAAFFFGGLTALDFLLDRAELQFGETVLIHGATGAVGSAAIQLARAMGAVVVASCSAENAVLARSLGADQVLDYRTDPPIGPFDVIVDVLGKIDRNHLPSLMPSGGRLILLTADLLTTLGILLRPVRGGVRFISGNATETRNAMKRLVNLHHSGAYRPLVGRVMPFEDIRKAHALASSMHKPGNLVIRIA